MKIVLIPKGETAPLKRKLARLFPQAKVLGSLAKGEILLDLLDSEPHLPYAIRASLGVDIGPDPGTAGPVWNERLPTQAEIDEAFRQKRWRPTVVALVRDECDRLLLVQAARNGEWGVVQGGIEEGESPLVALARELREEIDVGGEFYAPRAFIGCADIEASLGSAEHLKFTVGVRYFAYEVAYRGTGELRLQKSELSDYKWTASRLDDPELLGLLATSRLAKQELIIGILNRLMP